MKYRILDLRVKSIPCWERCGKDSLPVEAESQDSILKEAARLGLTKGEYVILAQTEEGQWIAIP